MNVEIYKFKGTKIECECVCVCVCVCYICVMLGEREQGEKRKKCTKLEWGRNPNSNSFIIQRQ